VIRAVLTGQVLQEKQIAVVFKSLVLAAHRLNDEIDPEGQVRKELGSTLIDLSRHTGDSSDIIQSVIQEGDLDVEALEMKLDVSIRQQKVLQAPEDSLIFEPRVAATQSFQALYTICLEGFEELCQLDPRFRPFALTLFSEQSQSEDRTQMTAGENAELDAKIEAFLRLAGSRLRLMPAIKAVEWLIRRFQIHEDNTKALLTTFLPYHSIPAFVTLLSILPAKIPAEYRFLHPYIRSLTSPPRSVLVHEAIQKSDFLSNSRICSCDWKEKPSRTSTAC
ncbi:hypothetical protein BN1723_007770, partial [Verticillium longisporum]